MFRKILEIPVILSLFNQLDQLEIDHSRSPSLIHVDMHFQSQIIGHTNDNVFKDQSPIAGNADFYTLAVYDPEFLCIVSVHVDVTQGSDKTFFKDKLPPFGTYEGAAGAAFDIPRFPQGRIDAQLGGVGKRDLYLGVFSVRGDNDRTLDASLGTYNLDGFGTGVIAGDGQFPNMGELMALAEKSLHIFLGKVNMNIGTSDGQHGFHDDQLALLAIVFL